MMFAGFVREGSCSGSTNSYTCIKTPTVPLALQDCTGVSAWTHMRYKDVGVRVVFEGHVWESRRKTNQRKPALPQWALLGECKTGAYIYTFVGHGYCNDGDMAEPDQYWRHLPTQPMRTSTARHF